MIGNDVKLFQGVTLGRADQYLNRAELSGKGGISVGDRVIVSAGAVVLYRDGNDLSIGDDAIIGANAVVLDDVPPGEIWAGVPARRIGVNPAWRNGVK